MAIIKKDARLRDGLAQLVKTMESMDDVGETARALIDAFVEEVRTQHTEFGEAIEREDLQEDALDHAGDAIGDADEGLQRAYERAYYSVQMEIARRRRDGEAVDDQERQLTRYFSNTTPREFERRARSVRAQEVERLVSLSDRFLAAEHADVVKGMREAAAAFDKTGTDHTKQREGHGAASQQLDESRERAGRTYRAGRDVLSAVLRLEGRVEELDELAPSLYAVTYA